MSAGGGSRCWRSIPTKRRYWPGPGSIRCIRRVVLRRPEEALGEWTGPEGAIPNSPARLRLLSQDLTWYRITSRDLVIPSTGRRRAEGNRRRPRPKRLRTPSQAQVGESDMHEFRAVADWRDTARSAAAQPRPARRSLRHHHSQLEFRDAGDSRLPARRGAAQLAHLPVRAQQARVGLDRRSARRSGIRHRRRASGRARHGLRHRGRRDRSAGTSRRLPSRPPDAARLAVHERAVALRRVVSQQPDRARPAARQRSIDPRRGDRQLDVAIVSGAGALEFHGPASQPGDVPRRRDAALWAVRSG